MALVATSPEFLGWMSYAVRSHALLDNQPTGVSITNKRATVRAVEAADTVVYGSGCRHRLRSLLPDGVRAIELKHVVDAESLASLRERLYALASRGEGR